MDRDDLKQLIGQALKHGLQTHNGAGSVETIAAHHRLAAIPEDDWSNVLGYVVDSLTARGLRVVAAPPADPDPEPVFPIRSQDRFAVDTVNYYRSRCVQAGLDRQAQQVTLARMEISGWQSRHPGRIKSPDHDHVPAAQQQVVS